MNSCSEIIVAGFHRSGTSSVARLMHAAGLFVGDDLIGALPYNPYGHYEDRAIVRLHNHILLDNGINWQVTEDFVPLVNPVRWRDMEEIVAQRRRAHRLWGFKDPRVCLFLPAWKHLMPSAKVVFSFRHPAHCSYSLSRRHAVELLTETRRADVHRRFFEVPDLAPRMWLVYNRALLAFAERYPDDVIAIGFESLLRGFPLIGLVRRTWGANLQDVPTFPALDPLAKQDRDHPQPLADPKLADELAEVWADLEALERRSAAALVGGPLP